MYSFFIKDIALLLILNFIKKISTNIYEFAQKKPKNGIMNI